MKYGIIGIGNLGTSLAHSLFAEGIEIGGLYSRRVQSILDFNQLSGLHMENSLNTVINNSDIVFISVSDGEIEHISERISEEFQEENLRGKLFIHMSGLKTSDALHALKEKGAFVCSFHPIQTFPDRKGDREAFNGISCGFEGEDAAIKILNSFINKFNISIIKVGKDEKALYHAAAVFLCNFMSAVAYMGEQCLQKIGIDKDMAYKAFKPLMERTLRNITKNGSVSSLSGPVSRGDIMTISKHKDVILDKAPEFTDAYIKLSEVAAHMSMEKGTIDNDAKDMIIKILNGSEAGQ